MPVYPRETKRNGTVYDVVVAQGRKRIWRRGIRSRDEARKLLTKLEGERDRGLSLHESPITVEAYLEGWLKDYVAGLPGKQTLRTYAASLRVHITPFLGKKRLRDLTPLDVQNRYGEIIKKRSAKTCLNVHRVLREALNHAVRLEVIKRNVCDHVLAPRPQRYRLDGLDPDDIATILIAADATQYGALCRLALWTGLRQGELTNLRWADLDLDAGLLYVREGKRGSQGVVVLGEEAIDMLRAHGIGEEIKYAAFGPTFKRAPFVFTNGIGAQVDAGGLRRTWQQLRKKTGVNLRFHDLRHAHASLLIRAGVHAKVVQERLRHRNISTTMDIYGHLMPGLQEEAVRKFSEMMKRDQG